MVTVNRIINRCELFDMDYLKEGKNNYYLKVIRLK